MDEGNIGITVTMTEESCVGEDILSALVGAAGEEDERNMSGTWLKTQ